MIDISTRYLGLTLKSPLVASASPLCESVDNLRRMEDVGIAAVVLPSLFEEQLQLESLALDSDLSRGGESFAESPNYFPDLQTYNLGPEGYLELIRQSKQSVSIPVIGSLNGVSEGGWVRYAGLMQEAGADAIELNLYSLVTDPTLSSSRVEQDYCELVSHVKSSVTIPVAVKLSQFFTAIPYVARRLGEAGADALVLFNRFYQPEFDLESLDVVPNLSLSNSQELLLRLHWVALLYGRVGADLAVTGGVHTAEDVLKTIMAGANVAMMTSALRRHGIERAELVLGQLKRWMEEHEYESIRQMRGSMSHLSTSRPDVFERVNYMKVLSLMRCADAAEEQVRTTEMQKTLTPEYLAQKFRALQRLTGNTPLLGIHFRYRGMTRSIYAKAEQLNMTGSIKDRMALHILKRAYEEEKIRPGDIIAEATSGNTGISFAAIGSVLGHPVSIFMPDWMSHERRDLIRSYGARIVSVSKEQGGFLGSIRMAEEFATRHPDVFLPRQFSNDANVDARMTTTGPEIHAQLQSAGLRPDAFVAGVGTGGTVMGVGRFFRSKNPSIKIHPVEPAESPTLSTGHKVGEHRIQGISDEFIPAIVDFSALDEIITVSDGDSILMAQKLAAKLGLAVGVSSGCNFLAAVSVLEHLGPDAVVVTVFPDDNKKYLSTDLLREEPCKENYLAPGIKLLGLETFQRDCTFCKNIV